MDFWLLKHYVNDYSNILSPEVKAELDVLSQEIENESSLQAVVVIFPHREWEALSDIALKAFNDNKIGQKWKNNGLLLSIVSDEKKIRITVGKWLEWIYTNQWCKNIIQQKLRPALNAWDYKKVIKIWIQEIQKMEKIPHTERVQNAWWKYNRIRSTQWISAPKFFLWAFWFFGVFFGTPLTAIFISNKSTTYALFGYIIFALLMMLFIIFKTKAKSWLRTILIALLIYTFFAGFPVLITQYTAEKRKIFCEENPVICEQQQLEKERQFCENRPTSCTDNRINYESVDYKDYLKEQARSSSSSSSRSSSSSSSSSSSFWGGWWSSNGWGWWD